MEGVQKHAAALNVEFVALCDPWRIAREAANAKVRAWSGCVVRIPRRTRSPYFRLKNSSMSLRSSSGLGQFNEGSLGKLLILPGFQISELKV